MDGRPYFRPPYGRHSPATDRLAADLGYPTITLWSDTIGDSRQLLDLIAARKLQTVTMNDVFG